MDDMALIARALYPQTRFSLSFCQASTGPHVRRAAWRAFTLRAPFRRCRDHRPSTNEGGA